MCIGCGSVVPSTSMLDARNFKGPSLASDGFWLRVSCVVGKLMTLLQVMGAYENPCLLVLGVISKPHYSVG